MLLELGAYRIEVLAHLLGDLAELFVDVGIGDLDGLGVGNGAERQVDLDGGDSRLA